MVFFVDFFIAKEDVSVKTSLRNLLITAVLMAVGFVLPFLTGQIPSVGNMLSPLHLPVLICGLCCGWQWGLLLGAVLPVARSFVFGMPPMLPTALAMAFEMAAYGTLTGVLYGALLKMRGKNHAPALYGSLVAAMVGGRLVHGAFMAVYMGLSGGSYTWQAFITADFLNAWPGMILHLLLVPPVVLALERARLSAHPALVAKA